MLAQVSQLVSSTCCDATNVVVEIEITLCVREPRTRFTWEHIYACDRGSTLLLQQVGDQQIYDGATLQALIGGR
ncbi:hypothetical protein OUZ56_022981 [Daphnia magna]|uniref:Uncharacterized protein n=1 Tax=Daphnia magna TaxID=35525 RepID=A0ABR0AY21_9CRUS|nr:hypothetical protein OUZ56_022981 [Daphnia magna]